MRRISIAICALVSFACPQATAADRQTLQKLQAPPPAEAQPIADAARPIRLVRLIIQLSPAPWAWVSQPVGEGLSTRLDERLLTWTDGQLDVDTSAASLIVRDEMIKAGVPADQTAESIFSQPSSGDLQLGVRITRIQGRFCLKCTWGWDVAWSGAVVMQARWEVYSPLDRKILASVETQGGYSTTKQGISGDPEQLIYEAFRDNVRRLINSPEFRRVVTEPQGENMIAKSSAELPIILRAAGASASVPQVSKAVAIVFAADGSGSGFLVSNDGYLLTNDHVVGGSKYVKLKWSDGRETLGEVIRTDPRRDVALVKTEPQSRAPLAMRLTAAQQGETVFAIGTPLEEAFQNTLTKGIVSANRMMDGLPFIQSDVAIDHGNSGGPLLDEKGRVIGMAVSRYEPGGVTHSINFFIPIDDALRALSLKPAT